MPKKEIKITSNIPVRLDRYIKRIYPDLAQSAIEKMLRQKKIRLNGMKAKSNDRVCSPDILHLFSDLETKVTKKTIKFSDNVVKLANKLLDEFLIIKNEHFIAINKPCNLAVQGGSKINISVNDAINYLNQNHNYDLKLVHRLDKKTSGILLLADGHDNAAILTKAFKDRNIEKRYIAIIKSRPNKQSGEIVNFLQKVNSGGQEIVRITESQEGSKLARTEYKILDYNEDKNISQIEFKPVTGRMHQLRVHAASLGCSIIGDVKYGGEKATRMFLHAREVFLPVEVFGKSYRIEAKLPEGFFIK